MQKRISRVYFHAWMCLGCVLKVLFLRELYPTGNTSVIGVYNFSIYIKRECLVNRIMLPKSCAKLLGHFVVKNSPKSMLARVMHCKVIETCVHQHCFLLVLARGEMEEGEGGGMLLLNHLCHFVHIILIMNVLMISRPCVP